MRQVPSPPPALADYGRRLAASLAPQLWTDVVQRGYGRARLVADVLAAVNVAIVALPLSMAIAIASGVSPEKGLITAVIAGFLISAFSGSRFQIGGPTAAFIVTVYGTIAQFGYDGFILATLMAGVILIIAATLRVGDFVRFVPDTVMVGFTTGIAIVILASQLKDLFGLNLGSVPPDLVSKLSALWAARGTLNPWALACGLGVCFGIAGLRIWAPRLPGILIMVVVAALLVALARLPIETVGDRFGAVSLEGISFAWPDISYERLRLLIQPALTIAFLAGIESLLSAMVADGMTHERHRPNAELLAQGIANIFSGLLGGICATGAISRTATNIRSGATGPMAGVLHALMLLAFASLLSPWLGYIPMAALAGVLVLTCVNMVDRRRFIEIFQSSLGDRVVLLSTFTLTLLVDLTLALEVGVVLSAMIFMHRMAQATVLRPVPLKSLSAPALGQAQARAFRLEGPLFFGSSQCLAPLETAGSDEPVSVVLDLKRTAMVDSSGVEALRMLAHRLSALNASLTLVDPSHRVRRALSIGGVLAEANVHESHSGAP